MIISYLFRSSTTRVVLRIVAMEDLVLDSFCNSTFWDVNLTWNTDSPQLTPCFQKTVLVWIPSIFLWTFSSIDIYNNFSSKASDIPWNWRNVSRLELISILIFICTFELFYNCFEENAALVDIVTPLIRAVTFLLCSILIYFHKKYGRQSSGVIFIFWLLIVIFGSPQFVSGIKTFISGTADATQIIYTIMYMLSFVSFLLNFISDLPPRSKEYPKVEKPSPEDDASFPSRIAFSWFDSLAYLGFKQPLTDSDLWSLRYTDKVSQSFPIFDKHWSTSVKNNSKVYDDNTAKFSKKMGNIVDITGIRKSKVQPSSTSICPALVKSFGLTYLIGTLLKLIFDLLIFLNPQLLKYLIEFVESDEPQWRGIVYALLLFVVSSCRSVFNSEHFYIVLLVGIRVRAALISAIYRKALRLSNATRKQYTVGEIVNLMSVDVGRIKEITADLNMIWSAPLQISLALYFLWQTLGLCVLAGVGVIILMIPLNAYIASRVEHLQVKQMKSKDERVKMMNEILSGIKVLKFFGWEPSFEQQVTKVREKETNILKQSLYFNAFTAFLLLCTPFLVSLATFSTYVFLDPNNVLDAEKAFVSLSLFGIVRFPLTLLPRVITNGIQAIVSVKRINKFLNSEELDSSSIYLTINEDDPVVMEKGTFSWGVQEQPTLHDIDLRIMQGSLVAVVGTVGSGKSSLISAFLGEMDKISGHVRIQGSVAYVPQHAWIQNATLQDNILFGKTLNNRNYQRVIDACALKPDLEMLPGGDQTEIGEKGINLSGGQKQRVSLARAVYADCDIYFLDDPLSAVDSHVGKHIFENVIASRGILRKKTRIFVTHGISFLPEVDQIVVLKGGTVSEVGTYKELLEKKGAFSEFLLTYLQEGVENDELDELDGTLKKEILKSNPKIQRQLPTQKSTRSDTSSISSLRRRRPSNSSQHEKKQFAIGKLNQEEKAEIGSIKWHVYKHYLRSIGLGLTFATIICIVLYEGFYIGSQFWLSKWANDAQSITTNGTQNTDLRDLYVGVYGVLGIGQCLMAFASDALPRLGCWLAAVNLHKSLLATVLRVPLSFMDTTPQGRILARFSNDMNTLDDKLPVVTADIVFCFIELLGSLFIISYPTPLVIVAIIPLCLLYYFLQKFYVCTSTQIKRMESITTSPIYSHFEETISGASIIRAYSSQERFILECEQKVDNNHVSSYFGMIADRWLNFRLEVIANLLIFSAALFVVLGKDSISPGIAGLSISYALQVTHYLNWMVRMSSLIETNIVSVERIKQYIEAPQEAPWEISSCTISKEWPEEGKIVFSDYQVRYREGLDLVLKGISFSINAGEKVGIVGRTGAGKSSLTLGLFRIIEAAGGKILIDGVDIATLGLHSLRTRLTIIPQDPVLFSGTLRLNLDPFEQHSHEQIWRALELAHLKTFVSGLTSGFEYVVSEGGVNLSVGQRQLICLARALLRKSKVLILDEATASVDLETDDLIQKTIRSEFKHSTVLTIAHRLNTIIDYDRVLVLDEGMVAEYDSPSALMNNKNSIFFGMVHDAGLV